MFVRTLFPGVAVVADKKNYLLSADEKKLLDLLNNHRGAKNLRPVHAVAGLCRMARDQAATGDSATARGEAGSASAMLMASGAPGTAEALFKGLLAKDHAGTLVGDWQEVGVGFKATMDKQGTVFVILYTGQSIAENRHCRLGRHEKATHVANARPAPGGH